MDNTASPDREHDCSLTLSMAVSANLTEAFWESRPALRQLRRYAARQRVSPEALLGHGIARTSAMVPPGTQIHSTDLPSGLDTLVAIVGDPGASKTKALKLGQKIMEKPQGLDCPIHLTDMIDGLGISSGPGLIESFMGVDEHGNRVQATHNALFCCDEGSVLKAIGSRNGEILDEVLRCIFAGSDLSTPNATKDRWRHVTDYCVGVVINLQPKSVGLLLSQSGDGSPQRFLWFPATDPNMPESPERCEVPRFPVLREPRQIHFDESIKRAIDRHQFKRARGEVTIDSLEVHLGGWVRAKVSLA